MAGIGFALRDLMRRDSLWSIVESQLHGIVVVAGPWFFTILAMALPSLFFDSLAAKETIAQFVTLLLYVFSASLTVSGPIAIGLTRHISDRIYENQTDRIASAFVGALLIGLLCSVPVVALGWWVLDLPRETLVGGSVAYGLVTSSWIAAPMLSTLREFRLLTATFAVGTIVFGLALLGHDVVTVPDLLLGFNLGMAATVGSICALVLRSFPGPSEPLLAVVPTTLRYWDLALGGLLYGAGIWADKWIMWSAPEHLVLPGGLVSYPTYDTVAFIAYVTTVPAFALFIIQAETTLHDRCSDLYGSIVRHASRSQLQVAHGAIIRALVASFRDVALLQLGLTTLILLLPTLLLDLLKVPHGGVFMFRFCAMGAMFQSGMLMLTIVLHYFDSRRAVLAIHGTFAVANALFTLLSLHFGLSAYGLGYFGASVLGFVVAYVVVATSLRDLLYLAFVRQNEALADVVAKEPLPTQWFPATTKPGPLDAPTA